MTTRTSMTTRTLPEKSKLNERISGLSNDKRAQLRARLRAKPDRSRGDTPWFIRFSRGETASIRLFCFSYAGGGASTFRSWNEGLPPDVDVWAAQLPGRETRVAEQPLRRMPALVDELYDG